MLINNPWAGDYDIPCPASYLPKHLGPLAAVQLDASLDRFICSFVAALGK